MTFSKGSLILVDYTSKVKDTEEVFETTIEEEAKKHSFHDPNVKYQPKLVSVGESWVIKGFDEALEKTSVGDKKINVIKVIREITSLGLKEAKDLVEAAPKEIKSSVAKKDAEDVKKKLEAAGAKVELK